MSRGAHPRFGIVKDRADPTHRGRVRVFAPAVYGKALSPWAKPVGLPLSGATGRGLFAVPDTDSIVLILFVGGDLDQPVYMAGPWAEPGGASDAPATGKVSPPDVRVLETGKWLLTFDDRQARRFEVKDKTSGTVIAIDANKVEINAGTLPVTIVCGDATVTASGIAKVAAQGDVDVDAAGKVTIDATTVEINGATGPVVTGGPGGTHPTDYVTGAPINGVPTVKAG